MVETQDKVFTGATRPSMFWGTHYGAVIINVIVVMYAFWLTDSLWAPAAACPIHLMCVAISRYDPHAFRLIGLKFKHWFETIGNRAYWRASSRSPYSKREF